MLVDDRWNQCMNVQVKRFRLHDNMASLPVLKGAVVFEVGPFTSSKQWSLYTTTLNIQSVKLGRVEML